MIEQKDEQDTSSNVSQNKQQVRSIFETFWLIILLSLILTWCGRYTPQTCGAACSENGMQLKTCSWVYMTCTYENK